MRKPSPERLKEADALADWCEFVVHTCHELFFAQGKDGEYFKELQLDGISKARERADLRGLRMVQRDQTEMVNGLNAHYRAIIDRRLCDRFGRGLEDAKGKLEKQVRTILMRGTIRKADEYRVLEAWMGMILDDPSRRADVDAINGLLAAVTKPLPE